MFLFTTPASRAAAPAANPVVEAIRAGAEQTGTSFDYLLATARRESGLDPGAKAPSSSATGLFQFIDQTWLGLVKTDGARFGLADQAAAITARADGTYAVEDAAMRQAILDLRRDPAVATALAGAFTQRNRDSLAASLGREPSAADLYTAHFLGARGAADLIRAARQAPNRPAARDFPEAAASNRSIFYDRAGRARGAAEVYALLAAGQVAAVAAPAPVRAETTSAGTAVARADAPAFHGLFQSDNRRGPISDSVSRLWRVGGPSGSAHQRVAGFGFFPRSTPAAADDAVTQLAETGPAASGETAQLPRLAPPLPPPRPARLGEGGRNPAEAGLAPLDLSLFRKRRKA